MARPPGASVSNGTKISWPRVSTFYLREDRIERYAKKRLEPRGGKKRLVGINVPNENDRSGLYPPTPVLLSGPEIP